MHNKWLIIVGVLALLALTACQNNEAGTAPTNTASPTTTPAPALPSATPFRQPTLPPTWTPVASPTLLSADSGGSINQGAASATPKPTLTNTPPPPDDICFIFTPDSAANIPSEAIDYGSSATIYWNPIPVAGYSYEVKLYHPDGNVILDEVVSSNQYTFPLELLNAGGYVYGWEVTPILNGLPTCFPITGEIYVDVPIEG